MKLHIEDLQNFSETKTAMSIETPQYKLIKKEGGFEIRSYDEMVVARTSVNSDYKESTLTGFYANRRLYFW